jgi:hypothetical protein
MESPSKDCFKDAVREISEEVGIDNDKLNLFFHENRIDELTALIIDKIKALKAVKANTIASHYTHKADHQYIDEDTRDWPLYRLNIPDTSIIDSLDAPLFIHTLENWSPDVNMRSYLLFWMKSLATREFEYQKIPSRIQISGLSIVLKEAFLQVLLPIAMQFSVYKIEVYVRERPFVSPTSRAGGQMLSFQDNSSDDPFLKQQEPVYDLRIRRIFSNDEFGLVKYEQYEEVSNLATMSSFDANVETTEIRFQAMDLEQGTKPPNITSNLSSNRRMDFTNLIPPAISSWFHPNTTTLANSINHAIAHDIIVKSPSDASLVDSVASASANVDRQSPTIVQASNLPEENRERSPSFSSSVSSSSKIAARLEMLRRKASESDK